HERPEAEGEEDREHADLEVGAGREEEPRELVAPELVRPEQMLGREPREDVVEVLVLRVVRAQHRREDRGEDDERRQREAGDERRAAAGPAHEARAPGRGELERGGDVGHPSRMRGSSLAASRSVSRLTTTTLAASTSVTDSTTGKSRSVIECSSSEPSPFRLKTCSTTTVLPI